MSIRSIASKLAGDCFGVEDDHFVSDDLAALLDAAFLQFFPSGPRLLKLLEERGWTGWTNIRRTDPTG